MTLEEKYSQAVNIQSEFSQKSILFIGTESYDAPSITVLQGLDTLGFDIYTIKKSNINSWFCDEVIEDPTGYTFDFVLSSFHWGTRWSYYDQYDLESYPWILIDGDDNPGLGTIWRDKYEHYRQNVYKFDPPKDIKDKELMPYRWVEPLYDYDPDMVFTSQKQFEDETSHYIPFGIHRQYSKFADDLTIANRTINLTHIPGPGVLRKRMQRLIKSLQFLHILPEEVHNEEVRGEAWCPNEIEVYVQEDENIHSYHRWKVYEKYFKTLNNSKVIVYPGIDSWPFWDSKRPWEALSCGCYLLMRKPNIDVSEYPVTELDKDAVYDSYTEFIRKYRYLSRNPYELEKRRSRMSERAQKYFSPTAIARYFLWTIQNNL